MSIKQLWAPWRMEFLTDPKGKPEGCVFCMLLKEDQDRRNLIVHRGEKVFVILNKYTYNNGHLMVIPFKHSNNLTELNAKESHALMEISRFSVEALRRVYKPEGFNLGMNLGASAGAGIRDHLHMHVVPRWQGDTNFMPVIAETKAMPQHLEASFDQLKPVFEQHCPKDS